MKKFAKLFFGFAAVATLSSCSNDEPTPATTPDVNGEGNNAYMTIRLLDAAEYGRSTSDGGYEYGLAAEQDVNDARFFFFDENGIYVQEAGVWNDGNDETVDKNIDFKGNAVIVLKNLTSNTYPKYLLTVLNAPDFKPESTLKATAESLQMQCINKIGETNYFVMSTSSYYGEKDNHVDGDATKNLDLYYANVLNTDNFLLQPADEAPDADKIKDKTKIVNVYVERLASKVQLNVSDELKNETVTTTDGRTLYKLNASVAGSGNIEGGDDTGATDVYVEFLGWDLNGTAKKTYLSKQLLPEWKTTEPFAGWQAVVDRRNYWAKSWVYNQDITTGNVDYKGWSVLGKKFGADLEKTEAYAYCNENTNVPGKILDKNNKVVAGLVTSAVVKARVCDKNGNALDLVRHNGLLFKKEAYCRYVLDAINKGAGLINIWYPTKITKTRKLNDKGEGLFEDEDQTKPSYDVVTEYAQIDASYVTMAKKAGAGTGIAEVVAIESFPTHTVTVITKDLQEGQEGLVETTTTEDASYCSRAAGTATNMTAAEAKTALVNYLSAASENQGVETFTGGAMYYNIPVEHLVASDGGKPTDLGYYGVVRNHWYKISINNLMNVGHGIFNPGTGTENDPGEPIITDENEPERYYLAASINILSWKVVKQNADL